MLNEVSMIAKPANKASRYVFLGLVGTAIILILAVYMGAPFSGIIWTVVFALVIAALYIYNQHVASEFCYELSSYGGIDSFIVSMKVGKTEKTLARLDADAITEVRHLNRKEYRAYKCEKNVYKYTYFPTMFADSLYLVSIRSENENADLFIEATEEFARELERCIPPQL